MISLGPSIPCIRIAGIDDTHVTTRPITVRRELTLWGGLKLSVLIAEDAPRDLAGFIPADPIPFRAPEPI